MKSAEKSCCCSRAGNYEVSLYQAWVKDNLAVSASHLAVTLLWLPSLPERQTGEISTYVPCMSPAFPEYLPQKWTEESAMYWPPNHLNPHPLRTTVLLLQPTHMPPSSLGQLPRMLSASPTSEVSLEWKNLFSHCVFQSHLIPPFSLLIHITKTLFWFRWNVFLLHYTCLSLPPSPLIFFGLPSPSLPCICNEYTPPPLQPLCF